MIISKNGEAFSYEGITYTIGQAVYANNQSDYEGLFGTILEIRDGEDKETENDKPEIVCRFDLPVLPYDINRIEERFTALYRQKKTVEEVPLDCVIMAPEMLTPVQETAGETIYLLTEEWNNDGEMGTECTAFSDLTLAKAHFHQSLKCEFTEGLLSHWKDHEKFEFESDEGSFVGWIEGFWSENHYCIQIEKKLIIIPKRSEDE